MSDYPILTALGITVGTGCFLAILVPLLIVQYWRYGRLSATRLLGTAAVSVYLCSLIAFTLFPLPTVAEACGLRTGPLLQAIPFGFVADIAEEAAKTSLPGALTGFVTLQVVLKVVLFVPFGILARGMTHRGVAFTTAAGFGLSLLVEATQYSGVWGLYPCGFRVADVDDLMTNTAGALIGALLAPLGVGWIRPAAALRTAAPPAVNAPRRLLGMALDWFAFTTVAVIATVVLMAAKVLMLGQDATQATAPTSIEHGLAALVAAVLVLAVPTLVGSGASVGQRLVGIAPVWADGHSSLPRRLLRASAVGGVYAAGRVLPALLDGWPLLPGLISGVSGLVVLVAVISALIGDHRGLSGWVSGARMVDRRRLLSPGSTL
ncbi:VanZ family protein [Brachybacterium muris]|uniref:VanZ family protein n=1 Tax=Brachybacterium muris TaxID=219301 RepID=UPI0021A629F8|nr:VanZ family protein [Brachybacterium muris]MCT1431802.1 VanZ family protein [Brachybacterium muris]